MLSNLPELKRDMLLQVLSQFSEENALAAVCPLMNCRVPTYFKLIKTAFETWNLQFNRAGFNARGYKLRAGIKN